MLTSHRLVFTCARLLAATLVGPAAWSGCVKPSVTPVERAPRPHGQTSAPAPRPATESQVPKHQARHFSTAIAATRYAYPYKAEPKTDAAAWHMLCGKALCKLPLLLHHPDAGEPKESQVLVADPKGGLWMVENLGVQGEGGSEQDPWQIVFQPSPSPTVRVCGYAEVFEPIYGDYAGARKGPSEGYDSSAAELNVTTGGVRRSSDCMK